MKNLYLKGKGKIHPSPADGGGGDGPSIDALAVLKLLPATILALTAALSYEDKEVVAYLITRSIHGLVALGLSPAAGAERRRCRGMAPAHRPLFNCGCFDCYISFWSRWNGSPDCELIHQVIEAFEEQLASSESKGGKGRRRERSSAGRSEKGKAKGKDKDRRVEVGAESPSVIDVLEQSFEEPSAASEAVSLSGEAEEALDAVRDAEEEADKERSGDDAAGGERRRGWPDVMGLFNSRFWNLWGPSV